VASCAALSCPARLEAITLLDGEGLGLDEPGLLLMGLEDGSGGLGLEVSWHTPGHLQDGTAGLELSADSCDAVQTCTVTTAMWGVLPVSCLAAQPGALTVHKGNCCIKHSIPTHSA
jgi:hypothetical protein